MIDKFNIQKLRELDILQVADLLGMGLRNKRILCRYHRPGERATEPGIQRGMSLAGRSF